MDVIYSVATQCDLLTLSHAFLRRSEKNAVVQIKGRQQTVNSSLASLFEIRKKEAKCLILKYFVRLFIVY